MKITDLRVKTIYAIGQVTQNRFNPGILLSTDPWTFERDRDLYRPDPGGKGWGTIGSGFHAITRGLLTVTCDPDPALVDGLSDLADTVMAHLLDNAGSMPDVPTYRHRLRLVRPQEIARTWVEQLAREEEDRTVHAAWQRQVNGRRFASDEARRRIAETVGGRVEMPAFSPHQNSVNVDWCDLEALCRAYVAGITEEPDASRPAASGGDS